MPLHMQKLLVVLVADFVCEIKFLAGLAVNFLVKPNGGGFSSEQVMARRKDVDYQMSVLCQMCVD